MKDSLVTVVVPVYNGEHFLARCLDSLLTQTEPGWQAVLVDDGSTDGSAALCDAYAARDERFRVIHQENGGVCAARNAGLLASRTPYTSFLDQDDAYAPALLANALAAQAAHPGSFVSWQITSEKEELCNRLLEDTPEHFQLLPKSGLGDLYLNHDFAPIWNKLFETALLQGQKSGMPLLFDVSNRIGTEDLPFALAYARRYFLQKPEGSFCLVVPPLHYYEAHNTQSVSKGGRHLTDYCLHTLERDLPLLQALEEEFSVPEEMLRGAYALTLHCLAYGIDLLPGQEGAVPSRTVFRYSQTRTLLAWFHAHRAYNPYYLPFVWKNARLVRLLFEAEQKHSRTYERLYWLGYYLLGGHWQR